MKKPSLLFIFFLFFIFNVKGQNLVPNGDFEQYVGCPTGESQLGLAMFWMNPATNIANVSGTPDYYHQCATSGYIGVPNNWGGSQTAHSGIAYSGIYLWLSSSPPNAREYIEAPFSSSLIAGNCYHFEMFANLADACNYTTNNIGVYFSNTVITGINNYYPLPFTPQINNSAGNVFDALNWTLVSGNYTAQGGENYLIIGNFNNDANTNTIGVANGTWDLSYVYIDDVSLSPCTAIEEQDQNDAIKIYPNPVKDWLNVQISIPIAIATNFQNTNAEIKITDVLGKAILRKQFSLPLTIGTKIQLPTSNFQPGIYFIEINDACLPDRQGKNVYRKKFLKE